MNTLCTRYHALENTLRHAKGLHLSLVHLFFQQCLSWCNPPVGLHLLVFAWCIYVDMFAGTHPIPNVSSAFPFLRNPFRCLGILGSSTSNVWNPACSDRSGCLRAEIRIAMMQLLCSVGGATSRSNTHYLRRNGITAQHSQYNGMLAWHLIQAKLGKQNRPLYVFHQVIFVIMSSILFI